MDHDDKEIMQRLCNAGLAAVHHYVMVSGETAATMPEYFLTSAIFNELARDRAVTLETPFWQIHQWIHEGSRVPRFNGDSHRWKVDMVIYEGKSKDPQEQKIWGFVEVKNGFVDADELNRRSDREKLLGLAQLFPKLAPKLICCGAVNAERCKYQETNAKGVSDDWFQAPYKKLASQGEEQFFCARVLNQSRL